LSGAGPLVGPTFRRGSAETQAVMAPCSSGFRRFAVRFAVKATQGDPRAAFTKEVWQLAKIVFR